MQDLPFLLQPSRNVSISYWQGSTQPQSWNGGPISSPGIMLQQKNPSDQITPDWTDRLWQSDLNPPSFQKQLSGICKSAGIMAGRERGRQHSSEQGQGASPGSIPRLLRVFCLHLPPSHCWVSSCAWGVSATVTGKWQKGFGSCHGWVQPASFSLALLHPWPADPRAASQLLISGALFPLSWDFPGLPLCVSLSSFCNGNLSLCFGWQLWLFCGSGSLMFGTITEWFATRISLVFLLLGFLSHLCLVQRTPRNPHF